MKKIIILFISIIPFVAATQTVRKAKKVANTTKSWLGKWERVSRMDGGTLEIKNTTRNYLVFEMDVFSGGHTGEVEGKAFINQNTAIYISKPGSCKLTFHLTGNTSINIDQDGCDAFEGMGTYFAGKYLNAKHLPKQTPPTLADLHVLNLQQDTVFRKLVDTSYQHFIDCTQLTSETVKNLDNFTAQVITSGVRGLFTQMEYIIMADKDNRIWTALINNESVYYFTNSTTYRTALPKTIDDWRSRFKEYPVVYMLRK